MKAVNLDRRPLECEHLQGLGNVPAKLHGLRLLVDRFRPYVVDDFEARARSLPVTGFLQEAWEGRADVNLNSIMLGTDDPQGLVDYYTKLLGEPTESDGGYTWWVLGTGSLTVGAHSEVQGKSVHPGRVIWNLETPDVRGEFQRMKEAGAIVVREPYGPEGTPEGTEMLIATLADPDGNYFQLASPM